MTRTLLTGVIPPVCTPLTPASDVDTASLTRLVDHLMQAKVHGLFILGSSSEVAFLTDAQRKAVLSTVVGHVAGQVPVLAGVIDTATPRVLDHVRTAVAAGVDGLVATAPFYTRTHRAEIASHFRAISGTAGIPLYAYDMPVSVHTKLEPDLLLDLGADEVLAGVKDSSGHESGLRELILGKRDRGLDGFSVLTGSELTVDTALWMGADGVVPGLGNVDPDGYVRLFEAAAKGDWAQARTEQERLFRLFRLVEAGSPARMGRGSSALGAFKAALHLRGIIGSPSTAAPQIPLDAAEIAVVSRYLSEAGLLAPADV